MNKRLAVCRCRFNGLCTQVTASTICICFGWKLLLIHQDGVHRSALTAADGPSFGIQISGLAADLIGKDRVMKGEWNIQKNWSDCHYWATKTCLNSIIAQYQMKERRGTKMELQSRCHGFLFSETSPDIFYDVVYVFMLKLKKTSPLSDISQWYYYWHLSCGDWIACQEILCLTADRISCLDG